MTVVAVRRKGAEHVTDVESDQDAGKAYEIARLPDGALACACMAYVFNKAKPKTCKHIRAYEHADAIERSVTDSMPQRPSRTKIGNETFTFKRSISFAPI